MKALISRKYLDNFDMKKLSKSIFELFDDYNFICSLVKENLYEKDIKNDNIKCKANHTNEEMKLLLKQEKYKSYLKKFNQKIENLKLTFTDDELIIFNYSIMERETDKEICDRISKTYKTYFIIKKSCYVKVALKFNLLVETVDEVLDKNFILVN